MRSKLRNLISSLRFSDKITEGEAKFQAFIKYAGDCIFMIDRDFQIIEVNDSVCKLLDYSGEELRNMKIYELITGGDQLSFEARTKIINNEGGSIHERKFKRKDGSTVDVEINVRSIEGLGYLAIVRNITERKKAETKILERESQLTALFDNIEGSLVMLDVNKQIVHYNNRFALNYKQLTNQDPQVGHGVFGFFPEEMKKELSKLMDSALKGNKEVFENEYLKDGKILRFRNSYNPVVNNGKVTGVICYTLDVTESREAEIKIRQSEERFRSMIAVSNTGGWEYHSNTQFVWCSPEYFAMLGRNVSDYDMSGAGNLKETWIELLHPEDRERATNHFAEYLKNPVGTYENYFRMQHAKGSWVWIWSRGQTLRNADGKLTNITVGTHIDITELQRADIKIRDSEEKFRMSFMTSHDAFYIGTLNEGRIIEANDSFYDLFGYTKGDSIGKTTAELNLFIFPDDRAKMIAALKTNGNLKDIELTCKRKNGDLIIVSITANVWRMNNEQVVMSVIRDITEQKRVKEELVESEVRFREVLENSLSASYKRNLQTNSYEYLSPVFKKITGYEKDEINNAPLEKVIEMMHPDDVEVVKNGILSAMKEPGKKENSLEYRFKHKTNGDYRWLKDEFVVMKDEKGQGLSLIGSVSDITESKRIETELIERTEQMALFVEYSPASLAMFDNDMRYIATSRRWLADYHLGGQQIIGKTHYEVFPEITQEWKDIHQRCLKGTIERRDEDSFPRTDGTTDWLRWEIRPWHKASGDIGGIIMFTEVITARKESELTFKNLVDKSLVGVYMIQKGKFVYVNPKFALDLGYTPEELLNMDDSRQIVYEHYNPTELLEWRKKVDAGIIEDFHIELKYQRKDGKIIWAEVYCGETLYKGAKAILGTFQDVTERKNAEAVIKEQAETFSAIIENANESILLLSPNLKVLQFNKTAKDRLRLNRAKEIYPGANFKEYLYIGSESTFMSMFNEAVAGKYPELESSQIDMHGKIFWLRTRMYPVYDTRKELFGITVLAENITERKKFEEQQLLITSIVNSTDDAIISKNPHGIITSWNKGAERILGYTFDEAIGIHVSIIIPPQLTELDNLILKNVAEGNSVEHFETQRKRKDGILIDVSLTISPITDSLGKIIGSSSILRDITESKKAEESVKQSEANYRQLFDNSPAPMWVIDEKTSAIMQVNKACIKTYGFSEEEFLAMTIRDIGPVDPDLAPKADIIDMSFMGSQRHIKKSGELIDVVTSSIPIRFNGEQNILLIAIDVTEKNLYEQQLTKAAIKAQEEERYEIGGELHDNVCQILAGSLMCLGLMENSLPMQSIDMFNRTHKYINQATVEIRNLSHRLAPAFFDKQTLEEAVLELLKSFNVDNRYAISLNVDPQFTTEPLNRDLQLNLYRILQEQLRNIMKHAKATKIEVDISLKKNNALQLKINDNGVGFNVKAVKKGIGLVNMNRRVQLFSGNLTINSAVGRGCKVLAEIPLSGID